MLQAEHKINNFGRNLKGQNFKRITKIKCSTHGISRVGGNLRQNDSWIFMTMKILCSM